MSLIAHLGGDAPINIMPTPPPGQMMGLHGVLIEEAAPIVRNFLWQCYLYTA